MREPILKHGLTALKAAEAEAKAETVEVKSVEEPVEESIAGLEPIDEVPE